VERLDDEAQARFAELAAECFDLAADLAAVAPHDARMHRLVDTLWLLREAAAELTRGAKRTLPHPDARGSPE
jgi:hypothetical protein